MDPDPVTPDDEALEELDAQIGKRHLVIEVPDEGPPTSSPEMFTAIEIAGLGTWLHMFGKRMIEDEAPDDEDLDD